MFRRTINFLKNKHKNYNEERIVNNYIKNGKIFGDMCSYLYMGKCVNFDEQQKKFEICEKKYVELGYQSIELNDFVGYGGYGINIDHLIKINTP